MEILRNAFNTAAAVSLELVAPVVVAVGGVVTFVGACATSNAGVAAVVLTAIIPATVFTGSVGKSLSKKYIPGGGDIF